MLHHMCSGYLFIYKPIKGGAWKCFLKQNDWNIGGMNMCKKELCGNCCSKKKPEKKKVNYSTQFMSKTADSPSVL